MTGENTWMIDDNTSLEQRGINLDSNRLLPNRYYNQSPLTDQDLEEKTNLAIFSGGDEDSKKCAAKMIKQAVAANKTVDFYFRPEWMPEKEGIATDEKNTFYSRITTQEESKKIIHSLLTKNEGKTLKEVTTSFLDNKKYDACHIISTYWNRDLPLIKKTGDTQGYLVHLADADNGDSFFKYLMERYLIQETNKIKTVDSKNRQVLEDRHLQINKNIEYIHQIESPLNGLKVLFLPEFDLRNDMVPRWRAEWPATHLGDFGIRYKIRGAIEKQIHRATKEELTADPKKHELSIVYGQEKSFNYLKNDIDWADVVIFQRTNDFFAKQIFDYAQEKKKKVGYDIDDLTFGDNAIQGFRDGLNRYIDSQIKRADFVTVSTVALKYEASKLRNSIKNVFQVRNRLQLDELKLIKKKERKKTKNDNIRIGWAGGPVHMDKLLDSKELIHRLYDKYQNKITLVLKGFEPDSNSFKELCKAFREGGRHVNIEGYGYTPSKDWRQYYQDLDNLKIDIFFAPAKKDSGHYAKSELKYLEATLINAPIVTHEIGEHEYVIQNGINGMLASLEDNNNEAFNCIDNLIQNPELRKSIVKKANKQVNKEYNIKKSAEELHKILLQLLQ